MNHSQRVVTLQRGQVKVELLQKAGWPDKVVVRQQEFTDPSASFFVIDKKNMIAALRALADELERA